MLLSGNLVPNARTRCRIRLLEAGSFCNDRRVFESSSILTNITTQIVVAIGRRRLPRILF